MNDSCSRLKPIVPGMLILFWLMLPAACAPESEEARPERPENVDIRPDVVFATADDRPLHIYIESQGIVEAFREIIIRPRVSGFVDDTALEDGRYIGQGDTLIAFADEEWRHQLSQAQNEVAQAEVAYNIERGQRVNRAMAGRDSSSNDPS